MNYPVWELAAGGGVLMAAVAVLHVVVSHFAVGGGLWLVLTERMAASRRDPELLAFVRTQSRVFILVTLVFGAITGVGIWTTAALISPHTIIALIRAYVWGWAMEWVFFVVEICAALVYWYGWDRLSSRTHQAVGWIYFISAWMSLVIINGIITFMLTPGGWLENHAFWTGFFNPTYWPSLVLRTGAAVTMAGLFTLLTAAYLRRGAARYTAVRWSAAWVLAGLAAFALAGRWYGASLAAALPGWPDLVAGAVPVLPTVIRVMWLGLAAGALVALWPLATPHRWNPLGGWLLFTAGLALFGGGEWAREVARKPYTIHGYLYSTGLLVAQEAEVAEAGAGAFTRWRDPAATTPAARGADLYRAWCQPCHTLDGYNGLRPYLVHWSDEQIAGFLPRLQHMRGLMPAWHGRGDDTAELVAHLAAARVGREAVFPDDARAAAARAFALHCGLCHTVDGFRPLRDSLAGLTREELDADVLDLLTDYTDEMPPYLADESEREHLLDYLEAIAAPDDGEQGRSS
jgi:mono/diheme cytochrome c family protein